MNDYIQALVRKHYRQKNINEGISDIIGIDDGSDIDGCDYLENEMGPEAYECLRFAGAVFKQVRLSESDIFDGCFEDDMLGVEGISDACVLDLTDEEIDTDCAKLCEYVDKLISSNRKLSVATLADVAGCDINLALHSLIYACMIAAGGDNWGPEKKNAGKLNFNWIDTSGVTSMRFLFAHDVNLQQERTGELFSYWDCKAGWDVDVSQWNTSAVTDMTGMFCGAAKFTGEGLDGWDVSKVKSMYAMFQNCVSLKKTYFDKWDLSSLKDMGFMYYGCTGAYHSSVGINAPNVEMLDYAFAYTDMEVDIKKLPLSHATTMKGFLQGATRYKLEGFNAKSIPSSADTSNILLYSEPYIKWREAMDEAYAGDTYDMAFPSYFESVVNGRSDEEYMYDCYMYATFLIAGFMAWQNPAKTNGPLTEAIYDLCAHALTEDPERSLTARIISEKLMNFDKI